jgi:hypothetical protein
VEERKKQLENCKEELLKKLKVAVQQEQAIGKLQSEESLFQEYVRVSRAEGVGDEDATKIVEELLEKARVGKSLATVTNKTAARPKGKGKADDGLTEKQKQAIWEHREHTHEIRRITKELTGRVRSLRYFTAVRDLQRQTDEPPVVYCPSPRCQGRVVPVDEIAVLSSCGHMGCFQCVEEYALREECIYAFNGEDRLEDEDMEGKKPSKRNKKACKAAARVINVVRGNTLGVDDAAHVKGHHYGRKLEQVIQLIQ